MLLVILRTGLYLVVILLELIDIVQYKINKMQYERESSATCVYE